MKQIIDNEYSLQIQLQQHQNNYVQFDKYSLEEFESIRQSKKMIYTIVYESDINRLYGSICYFLNSDNESQPTMYYDYTNINALHISQLFVNPNYRKQGIGRKLIELTEQYVKSKSINKIDLNTTAKNIPAQNLYKNLNFNIIFSTLSTNYINNNDNIQYKTIYEINNNIDKKINLSIYRLQKYFNNGFTFNQIKDHIVEGLKHHIYSIIQCENDLSAIITIQSKKVLVICDFLLENNQYNFNNLNTLLNSIYKYAKEVENLDSIKMIAPIKESNYIIKNFNNFSNKMLHLYKEVI